MKKIGRNHVADEVECDVLSMKVCGLLLGRPWQYDHNTMHVGRSNTYTFVHDGKQRTLKPMTDDTIQTGEVNRGAQEKSAHVYATTKDSQTS